MSGGPWGICSITEDDFRVLSSKCGLVMKFVDGGKGSGVEQVRALAIGRGNRIEILYGNGDGSGDMKAIGNHTKLMPDLLKLINTHAHALTNDLVSSTKSPQTVLFSSKTHYC